MTQGCRPLVARLLCPHIVLQNLSGLRAGFPTQLQSPHKFPHTEEDQKSSAAFIEEKQNRCFSFACRCSRPKGFDFTVLEKLRTKPKNGIKANFVSFYFVQKYCKEKLMLSEFFFYISKKNKTQIIKQIQPKEKKD